MKKNMLEKGLIQVYTGDGKGKTTAAIGLAIRALGAGFKVFMGQFVKGMRYSELNLLKSLPGMTIKQYGLNCFIRDKPTHEDIQAAQKGLAEIKRAMESGDYQLVIMDEANIATFFKLFSPAELLEAIDSRAEGVEVVITGRKAASELLEKAHLVTEMKEVKHYYQKGVEARVGIEK